MSATKGKAIYVVVAVDDGKVREVLLYRSLAAASRRNNALCAEYGAANVCLASRGLPALRRKRAAERSR